MKDKETRKEELKKLIYEMLIELPNPVIDVEAVLTEAWDEILQELQTDLLRRGPNLKLVKKKHPPPSI
jgi:hypothetical protein